MRSSRVILGLVVVIMLISNLLMAGTKIEFKDPKGDDKGPGYYIYPTDPIYVAGSFDLLSATIEDKGSEIDFRINFNAPVTFNWGDFWDVQQLQIYLDFDKIEGSGRTETIPGTQVLIDAANAWEKVVFIDPHTVPKINGEIQLKAADMQEDIVLPTKIRPIGKSIRATVSKADLGVAEDVDISKWGYGILMLSATGFPGDWCVLMRRVNEYNGQHRFGGGADGAGDPNVIDLFAGNADGSDDEAQLQYDMLGNWESGMDPEENEDDVLTTIKLVYPE
jgi:carbohydrate-binding DOMON domain-containing protein